MAANTHLKQLLTGAAGLGAVLMVALLATSGVASAQSEDTDTDGLPDDWETTHFGDLTQDGTGDPDSDGCDNTCEQGSGSDPNHPDTDSDGLTDGYEVANGSDPLDPADPPDPDSDHDGLEDAWETTHFGDLSQDAAGDPDSDGCDNACEQSHGTSPDNPDTDGDGMTDGHEIGAGSDPLTADSASTESAQTGSTSTSNTPVFHIEEWTTSPDDLERGLEFDLELKIRNVGTSQADDILVTVATNANFFNVGDTVHFPHLGVGSSRDEIILRVGTAPDLADGYYDIPIEISGYDVAEAARVTDTRNIGVYVAGLSPDASTSAFNIDSWTIQPENLYAGGQFDLGLTLTNIGTASAEEVLITIGSDNDFVDIGISPYFEHFSVGETETATLHVGVSDSVGGNYYSIPVEISFNNNLGQGNSRLSDTRTIGVYVAGGGTSSEVSEFYLERYGVMPDTISPGTSFQLHLVLDNRGSMARQFFARLGQSDVLAPLGGSNVQYLEQVESGSSVTLTYDLIVDGNAQAGLTAIDLNLEYEDVYGSQQEQTETLNLAVVETPHLQVNLFDDVPQSVSVGDEFDIPVEVINIGRDLVNINTIEVVSPQLNISEGTLYVGPLDGGSSGSLVAVAEATQVGTATVEARVHYLDSFQQPQTVTQTLMTVEVEGSAPVPLDEPAPVEESSPKFLQRLWQGILGLLGLRTEQTDEVTLDS